MGQSVLVTGGAGYVGSHTVADLVAQGHQVLVFDNLRQGSPAAVVESAELIVGDLADRYAIKTVFEKHQFDAVMHFAANTLAGESLKYPFRYFRGNVTNAINLIETSVEFGVKKFVFSSSCAIFGNLERNPIDEDVTIDPGSPYGESNHAIERVLHWAATLYGMNYASLRYFNAAGAHPTLPIGETHDPETHLIPLALQAALGQRPYLNINGDDYDTPDGTCVRDYTHVCDLADAHVRVLPALDQKSCQFNVGTGQGYSVREVIAAVKRITGVDFPVHISPRRAGDPPVLVAAPERARRDLGWCPRLSDLDTIISTAWAWARRIPRGYHTAAAAE